MRPDLLVCARCGGRVSEARCPNCRAALAELWSHEPDWWQRPEWVALVAVLLAVLLAVASRTA